MTLLRFSQVDVFTSSVHTGNPVAVVHDADSLTHADMAQFANWTNLSETTFLLQPSRPEADYRVRIFTPDRELAFAGHPTLGSAKAWLEAGGKPQRADYIVQECEIGLITITVKGEILSFAAPPLLRSGELDARTMNIVRQALGLTEDDIQAAQWIDNGSGFLGLVLTNVTTVLECTPNPTLFTQHELHIGILGAYPPGSESGADVEIRAFLSMNGVLREDPITGSLNAGFATWLIPAGLAPKQYVAAQGTVLKRKGRITIHHDGHDIWVGGGTRAIISGYVNF